MPEDIETIKKRLRRKYGLFECPARSHRIDLTEEQWRAIDWTREEIEINAALPHHMWNWRQDDRVWPLCRQFRGKNAFGPRALEHNVLTKYIKSPPKLVKGYNITRWMMPGDESVLHIPKFKGKILTAETLPEMTEGYERNPANPRYGQLVRVKLAWYGPTSLQKFEDDSWLYRDPSHYSRHKMIKRREVQGKPKEKTGADIVAFFRVGWRWDSIDNYYIKNAFYMGLAWN